MSQVLIRNIDEDLLNKLKAKAKEHGRSLQAELKMILEESAQAPRKLTVGKFLKEAEKLRESFGGRFLSDSAELIREDRER